MHHFTRVHRVLQPSMHHFTRHSHDFPSDLGDFTWFREGHAPFHFAALRAAMHHFTSDTFHYTRDQLYMYACVCVHFKMGLGFEV